jgi:hypothetical protein
MNYDMLPSLIDSANTAWGGILGILLIYRIGFPKPGVDEKFDEAHQKVAGPMRIVAPLLIVFGIVRFTMNFATGHH